MKDLFISVLLSLCRDLRAKLELALEKLLDACCNTEARRMPGAESWEEEEEEDREEDTEWLVRSPGVTSIVRKELAPAIRDLVHHGLGQGSSSLSVNPFSGCMSARGGAGARAGILHAWDVVMKFYEMKGGAEYNSAPARRLSRSFGLDLAGSGTGNKQVRTGNTIVYQKMKMINQTSFRRFFKQSDRFCPRSRGKVQMHISRLSFAPGLSTDR